jgi:hypothetical protein
VGDRDAGDGAGVAVCDCAEVEECFLGDCLFYINVSINGSEYINGCKWKRVDSLCVSVPYMDV